MMGMNIGLSCHSSVICQIIAVTPIPPNTTKKIMRDTSIYK